MVLLLRSTRSGRTSFQKAAFGKHQPSFLKEATLRRRGASSTYSLESRTK
jgi:hypothetical protein